MSIEERAENLMEEAKGLKGMIAEVQSKSLLLKFRVQQEQTERFESGEPMIPSESLCEEVEQSVAQRVDTSGPPWDARAGRADCPLAGTTTARTVATS